MPSCDSLCAFTYKKLTLGSLLPVRTRNAYVADFFEGISHTARPLAGTDDQANCACSAPRPLLSSAHIPIIREGMWMHACLLSAHCSLDALDCKHSQQTLHDMLLSGTAYSLQLLLALIDWYSLHCREVLLAKVLTRGQTTNCTFELHISDLEAWQPCGLQEIFTVHPSADIAKVCTLDGKQRWWIAAPVL